MTTRRRPTYYRPTTRRPPSTTQVRKGFDKVSRDVQTIKRGIQNTNIQTKVQADVIGKAIKKQGDRITGSEHALAASKIVDELKDQFPDLVSNSIVKTALPLLPLALLKPHRRGRGASSLASDPRVWGTAVPFLLLGLKELMERRDADAAKPKGEAAANGQLSTQNLVAMSDMLKQVAEQAGKLAQAVQAAQIAASAQSTSGEQPPVWLVQAIEQLSGTESAQATAQAEKSTKKEETSKASK